MSFCRLLKVTKGYTFYSPSLNIYFTYVNATFFETSPFFSSSRESISITKVLPILFIDPIRLYSIYSFVYNLVLVWLGPRPISICIYRCIIDKFYTQLFSGFFFSYTSLSLSKLNMASRAY